MFLLAKMPMITFASFVVIPQHAFATDYIGQPILERMLRGRNRFRDSPHGDLCERVGSKNKAAANQRDGLHVGDFDNIVRVLSKNPTKSPGVDLLPHARPRRGREAGGEAH